MEPRPSSGTAPGTGAHPDLPPVLSSVEELDDFLARPTAALAAELPGLDGDILILGVAGKVGPTLARMAARAAPGKRIVGVARFSDPAVRRKLDGWGVETIACDLLDRRAVASLPRLRNVVFMAGRKFGTSGDEAFTWAMNVCVPATVADVFAGSRFVAFSTLCVYPMADVRTAGCSESCPPRPVGEYANSCVGRERAIQFFAARHGSTGRMLRLNYAIDLRYGVLHDLGRRILAGEPIDLSMGYANIIWQGDAAAQTLRAFSHCTAPVSPLNIGAPANSSIRELATALGTRLGRRPVFANRECPDALITDASQAAKLFGPPAVDIDHMLDWTADWLLRGLPSHNKPTRYEVRNGEF